MLRQLGKFRRSLGFRSIRRYRRWGVDALERDLVDHINLGLGPWWEERFIEYLEERLAIIY